MTHLHLKLKQFNIQRFLLTNPTIDQWHWFGRSLDNKFKLLDSLLLNVKRGKAKNLEGKIETAMWLNTALGVYGLGQLFSDDATKLLWVRGPTSDSCGDCRNLNGQVHTSLEWRNYYAQTGKRPQGEGLACNGFRCLCTLVETDRRVSGEFT